VAEIETISHTARDVNTILTELENLVLSTAPDDWSDFFESNLGQLIIRFNALIGDMLSMGQDAVAIEVFLATCQRYESALRFCQSVGYVPRSATPASVEVVSVSFPASVTLYGATIAVGSTIAGPNGLQYELLEAYTIPVGALDATLTLQEGKSFTETFEPSSQPRQQISTSNGVVAEDSWEVYVGTVSPANLWSQIDSLALETTASKTYEVSFDGSGRLLVQFGDGAAGKIPDGTITVLYRTTNGEAGNAPIYSVDGSMKVTLGGGAGTASVQFRNSTGKATGGRDRESLSELRVNVPAYIRSQDKILTLQDYTTNVGRVAGVSLVFADILQASYGGNGVRVHIWDEEDVTFTVEMYDDSIRTDRDYTRYLQAPVGTTDDVQRFLRDRTPVNVHSAIIRPTVAWVDVYLSEVYYNTWYTREAIHQAIGDAIIGVFEAASGFRVELNELYNAIRDVPGVGTFYLDRLVLSGYRRPPATGTISLSAQPTDGDTIIISDGVTTRTFEFDSNGSVITGNDDVQIGADTEETLEYLRLAINGRLEINAVTDPLAVNPTLNLSNRVPGEDGNVVITKSGAVITVTGMSGGSDAPEVHTTDYRRIQNPPLEDDRWPPGTYDESTPATGRIVFDGGAQPTDTETIIVGDGVDTKTFEFDDNAAYTPGNIPVTIGVDADTTLANLKTAIEAQLGITGTVDAGATDPTLNLENDTSGPDGNEDITTTGAAITVSGMDGGGTGVGYWRDGGIEPYEPMQDLIILAAGTQGIRYYDDTYFYNNEIFYTSTAEYEISMVQAINLRRIIMELIPER